MNKYPAVNWPIPDPDHDPALPNVLLIGDSISMGYTLPVRSLLAGKANVYRPHINCGPTTLALEQLDDWLGDREWTVIHFNFGLHDLKHVDENGARVEPAVGCYQVPIERYAMNLETIVNRLKQTGASLIWASTTPVPDGAPYRIAGDEARYNVPALQLMENQGIAINDLHAFILPRLSSMQRPADVHFTDIGSEALAGRVAAAIEAALQPRRAATH